MIGHPPYGEATACQGRGFEKMAGERVFEVQHTVMAVSAGGAS